MTPPAKPSSTEPGQVTHLYNAMPPFSHRAPGVIGAAFDNDNVAVELIADGVHVASVGRSRDLPAV